MRQIPSNEQIAALLGKYKAIAERCAKERDDARCQLVKAYAALRRIDTGMIWEERGDHEMTGIRITFGALREIQAALSVAEDTGKQNGR